MALPFASELPIIESNSKFIRLYNSLMDTENLPNLPEIFLPHLNIIEVETPDTVRKYFTFDIELPKASFIFSTTDKSWCICFKDTFALLNHIDYKVSNVTGSDLGLRMFNYTLGELGSIDDTYVQLYISKYTK